MIDVDNVTAAYDAVYAGLPTSPTLQRIWRDHVLGQDYPLGFEHLSFATLGEMQRIADLLQLRPAGDLVDLGCGTGGAALWIARESRARLFGIDASRVAVARAQARASDLGLSSIATFSTGYFDRLSLDDESTDAMMSIDALQYAPNKAAVFAEAARVLRPRSRLVFTAFEVDAERSVGLPVFGADPVSDFRPLLERGGLSVRRYEETAGWQDRVTSTYKAVFEERARLEQEMGTIATAALAFEITATLDWQIFRRRVLVTAVRGATNLASSNEDPEF